MYKGTITVDVLPLCPRLGRRTANGTTIAMIIAMMAAKKMKRYQRLERHQSLENGFE
jgi:hypothetical protein